jgi:predicted secreted acid phosphatase
MVRRLFSTAVAVGVILSGLAILPVVRATEPKNLYLLKREIRSYVDSGEYDREISRVTGEAQTWLEKTAADEARKPAPARGRLAAVFDIDETLLSNLAHMRRMDFGYVPVDWDAWVDSGSAPPITPVCDLLRTARRLGIAVFILSGRHESDRPGTEKNLRAAGVGDYAGLWFKPGEPEQTTEAFKTAARRKITGDGYTIILNIGDQDSDLAGGYAARTFKLPDPFYVTR